MNMVNNIDKIESLVNTSARIPATHRSLVDSTKVMELVDQLRISVPQDVTAAKEIIAKKDEIIQQAQSEARRIRTSAEDDYQKKVNDNDILKAARERSDEMVSDAKAKSRRIVNDSEVTSKTRKIDADAYGIKALRSLEQQLATMLKTVRNGLDLLASETRQRTRGR